MTSGAFITWFLIIYIFIIFPAWELLNLRARKKDKYYETMSQYVTRKAEEGQRFWRWFVLLFPVIVTLIGVLLVFHWEVPCIWWGKLCGLTF